MQNTSKLRNTHLVYTNTINFAFNKVDLQAGGKIKSPKNSIQVYDIDFKPFPHKGYIICICKMR